MELEVRGEVFQWRGPAPYYYVAVPDAEAEQIAAVASLVSYGWGVIPVHGRIGATSFTTSLFPKDGGYLVPLKDAVRRPEGVQDGDDVVILLTLDGV
ncbi:DUF1905 domain-containing protein [Isoptericola sp. NEAU-Y5]|uniref:DUF1905 domain-containing protein n=1 Tax=Isoptericola luteus TaxID=2879484 RepID=A0ABS7ZGT0_9MICO|nr:DUF1905 domain-containing protein [Isoptericola sp. NEAU-Y5]MCA5894241.1 DUF1905 domain-containing protein [Isoptericola sp. NEAU-Y5]